jgi:hypothetical protein
VTVPDPTTDDVEALADALSLTSLSDALQADFQLVRGARELLASSWLAERDARVRAEAVRAFGATLGVNVGDEDDEWWRGYRQGQREALHAARKHADAIERGESR